MFFCRQHLEDLQRLKDIAGRSKDLAGTWICKIYKIDIRKKPATGKTRKSEKGLRDWIWSVKVALACSVSGKIVSESDLKSSLF